MNWDEYKTAFHVVANWKKDVDDRGFYTLPHDDYVRVVLEQIREIIREDDERGVAVWNAISDLCNEYACKEISNAA